MAKNVALELREDCLDNDEINLTTEEYRTTGPFDFEKLEREQDDSYLIVSVHSSTGEVLYVSVPEFQEEIHRVIKDLRGNPLPWTFSLASMNIKEKPLEDVLLAVYKKFKNVKIIGE